MHTLLRVSTSHATVAQTPKQVIWTLNKAKLYRYIPVVPAEQRHKVPLLLVFALMNRPSILDLRPGNSFVEYMVEQGYDVYLLDWGVPGLEDKELKFDDYVLGYLPRAIRKLKAVSGCESSACWAGASAQFSRPCMLRCDPMMGSKTCCC